MTPTVHLDHVSRSYPGTLAVDSVSFDIAPGTVHCLLGPNGAGKTTLLRLMAGLVAPSSGVVEVLGGDPFYQEIRQRIGWVPSVDRTFYMRLTGKENLLFFARLYGLGKRHGLGRAGELLELVGLGHAADRRVSGYSHGMTKRLAVARALIVEAPLILVDEATHDLDLDGSRLVRELFRARADSGATVVWSTHRLSELPGLVDTVTVLDSGVMRFVGPLDEMLMLSERPVYRVRLRKQGAAVRSDDIRLALTGTAAVLGGAGENATLQITAGVELGEAFAALITNGFEILDCYPETGLVERAVEARLRG